MKFAFASMAEVFVRWISQESSQHMTLTPFSVLLLSTIVKLFFKTPSEDQMKISSILLTSFLAFPKSLSASKSEDTLHPEQRSLLTCINNAQWGNQDAGCSYTFPICAKPDGEQIGWQVTGQDCFVCIGVRNNGTPYPYQDYGCTAAHPKCDAASNKAGKSCLGDVEIPCYNSAAYGGLDQGCEIGAPMCVAANGNILPASVDGDHCACCVNTQQANWVEDEGCSGATNRCLLDNGSNPDLNYAGTKCVVDGYPYYLDNDVDPGDLNTAHGDETAAQINDRMAQLVPEADPFEEPDPNLGPFNETDGAFRDPVLKAKCLDEAYTVPYGIDPEELYADYVKIFDWGFNNTMGHPLQSQSLDNNRVTNNRFPSMMQRMCFHDNSVDPLYPSFNQYVKDNLSNGKWNGPFTYLNTSGADASVLICPQERYHPNQNYDQTASRILYAMQTSEIGIKDQYGANTSMIDKYGLSYSDLLQNGGVAATIYLTGVNISLSTVFRYGRHDACHVPEVGHRYRLCGPTQKLPGVMLEAEELNDWFWTRGMNECTWLALMWTHTVMVSSLVDPLFLLR
jgi:hypothetical protein